VVTGISFLRIPRIGQKDYFGLGLMILLSTVIEATSVAGLHFFHKSMNIVTNFYSPLNLTFGIMFYQRRIEGFTKPIATIVVIIFLIFSITNFFFFQGIHGINSYTSTVASIGFMGLSVAYFANLFFQHSEHQAVRGMFWINAAILIYFSGTFFLHLLVEYLLKFLNNDLITILMIRNSLGLIFYALLTYGLIKVRREYLSRIIAI
jgi:hypothetical protein